MGAIVLDEAVIEEGAIIGAGALIPQGKRIPAGSLAVGVPAKVVRELSSEEAAEIERSAQGYRRLWQEHYRR
jgi:carbonic anhydrase/acetyltransferase-like protein (isoleucine patch superfamily)